MGVRRFRVWGFHKFSGSPCVDGFWLCFGYGSYGESQSKMDWQLGVPPWLGKPPYGETLVETYVDPHPGHRTLIRPRVVFNLCPLRKWTAKHRCWESQRLEVRDGGNIPKPQSTDFSSAFAFEVRNLEQPVSQSALGDKIPYVSCILFSAGGILRCRRFSPSSCEFFRAFRSHGGTMGYPLNRPYLFGGFSMNHGRIFPESPSEAKGARASGAIHGRGRAMPIYGRGPRMDVMGYHGMACQGGSLPTWCWAPSLRSQMFEEFMKGVPKVTLAYFGHHSMSAVHFGCWLISSNLENNWNRCSEEEWDMIPEAIWLL